MTRRDALDRATAALAGVALGDAMGMPTQTMTRAVICAQSIGGDIGVHDRVNHPAIGQPDANADDDSGDDRDPVR